jgi:hypothetical protein
MRPISKTVVSYSRQMVGPLAPSALAIEPQLGELRDRPFRAKIASRKDGTFRHRSFRLPGGDDQLCQRGAQQQDL